MNKQEQIFLLLCIENQPDTNFNKQVYVIIYILTTVHYRWWLSGIQANNYII